MNHKEALGIAAQAWCQPVNSRKILDPDLASAFADLLLQVVNDPGNLTCGQYTDAVLDLANPEVAEGEMAKHALLGLSGEVGEIADHFKKHLYMGHDLDHAKVILELGDVLWYLSLLARAVNSSLADVARTNMHKLRAWYPGGFTTKASLARADEISYPRTKRMTFATLVSEDDMARAYHGQGGKV